MLAMSGIETVFGLAASGAGLLSLGIQLGESAMKLKRIYHRLQNAPKSISQLIFSLETMAIALHQLEEQRQRRICDSTILARCIVECQMYIAEIKVLVDKMADRLARRVNLGGRFYATYKNGDVQQLLGDLDRAKGSLVLVYSMYLAEEQGRRHLEWGFQLNNLQVLVNQRNESPSESIGLCRNLSDAVLLTAEPTAASQTTVLGLTTAIAAQSQHDVVQERHLRKKRGRTHFQARFVLPSWLCRQVWHLAVTKTQDCWSMYLRTYNHVPGSAQVTRHCVSGNIEKLRDT
jgi:hypothetical protein